MKPLFDRFIAEARELLESAGSGLLSLERRPDDAETINAVFRAVHTLKGSAGLFDIPAFVRMVHAGEDLLGAVREGNLALTPEHCDLLFQSFDRATVWVDHLEAREVLPDDAHEISRRLCDRLRGAMPGSSEAPLQAAEDHTQQITPLGETAPAWLGEVAEELRVAAFRQAVQQSQRLLVADYTPDSQCFFSGEDPLQAMRQIGDLVALRIESPSAWPPAEEFDPYACVLGFRFATLAPRSDVETLFRYVPDQIRIEEFPAEALAVPMGDRSENPVFEDFAETARDFLVSGDHARFLRAINTVLEVTSGATWEASTLRWMQVILDTPNSSDAWLHGLLESLLDGQPPRPRSPGEPVSPVQSSEPATFAATPDVFRALDLDVRARALLQAQRRMIALPCAEGEWDGRVMSAGKVAQSVLAAAGHLHAAESINATVALAARSKSVQGLCDALDALLGQGAAPPADPVKPHEETVRGIDFRQEDRVAPKVLKVEQAKIDLLMNLIGEFVVAKNSLPFLARRAEEAFGVREMGREIKDQHAVFDRIAQEMQGAIMHVRMLPVSQLFQRFPRLVRDLSRKLEKQIDLVMEGEDTEADKNVIEAMADPLLHIVRNSLDHGVETPEDRKAAGKPPTATIRLKAYQEADAVLIEISDDGRGIDAERVRGKALEKGLITEDQARELEDDDAVQLVFLPGFSTAAEVTDLSGRGVGMDVVRTAVQKAGGNIRLVTRRGQGTVVTLRLPLSMAVTRVLVVESRGRLFGVPMDIVAETVRIDRSSIRRFKHKDTFVLRDQVVPLLRLCSMLQLPDEGPDEEGDEEAVLVARVAGNTVGIVIDRFKERIDIILKPLDGILAGLNGYAGTTLLGDGQVLPVLDLKELV